jgi:ADP-ribose pyrophosphatase YjhB (NUDIX family)
MLPNKTISSGGVVINKEGKILVVNQFGSSWSLPKGHVEEGEKLIDVAKREIREESGITELEYIKELGVYERPRINDPTEIKQIHMFLFTTQEENLNPLDPENPQAKWVDIDKVTNILTAERDKEFFSSIKGSL